MALKIFCEINANIVDNKVGLSHTLALLFAHLQYAFPYCVFCSVPLSSVLLEPGILHACTKDASESVEVDCMRH